MDKLICFSSDFLETIIIRLKYCDVNKSIYSVKLTLSPDAVDAGHRAVIFDRFSGVKEEVVGEGTHFLIPWVQKPIIFDCRSRPRNVPVVTGSKGMLASVNTFRMICLCGHASICKRLLHDVSLVMLC